MRRYAAGLGRRRKMRRYAAGLWREEEDMRSGEEDEKISKQLVWGGREEEDVELRRG